MNSITVYRSSLQSSILITVLFSLAIFKNTNKTTRFMKCINPIYIGSLKILSLVKVNIDRKLFSLTKLSKFNQIKLIVDQNFSDLLDRTILVTSIRRQLFLTIVTSSFSIFLSLLYENLTVNVRNRSVKSQLLLSFKTEAFSSFQTRLRFSDMLHCDSSH